MCNKKLIPSDDIMADIIKLARFRRDEIKKHGGKVLAITGSVGKTSVKEMVAHVLEYSGKKYYKSPANQNNTLGVPLCLLNTAADVAVGVYECGMNHKGELLEIGETLRPDIVIITNIRENHIGYLGSLQAIAEAKGELLHHMTGDGVAILEKPSAEHDPEDDFADLIGKEKKIDDNKQYDFFNLLAGEFKKHHPDGKVMAVGRGQDCDVIIGGTLTLPDDNDIMQRQLIAKVTVDNSDIKYELITEGYHQIYNSAIAMAGLRFLGIDDSDFVNSIKTYQPIEGRGKSEWLDIANKKILLIDESYNAAPASMRAGLKMLQYYDLGRFEIYQSPSQRLAILGDMKELGDDEIKYHQEVVEFALSRSGITQIILVGHVMAQAYGNMKKDEKIIAVVDNADQAIAELNKIMGNIDIIMVKASHAMGLEKIVKHLQNKNIIN